MATQNLGNAKQILTFCPPQEKSNPGLLSEALLENAILEFQARSCSALPEFLGLFEGCLSSTECLQSAFFFTAWCKGGAAAFSSARWVPSARPPF